MLLQRLVCVFILLYYKIKNNNNSNNTNNKKNTNNKNNNNKTLVGISYMIIQQFPGDLVVTQQGCMHAVFSQVTFFFF